MGARSLACVQFDFSALMRVRTPCVKTGATHSILGLPTSMNMINTISHGHTCKPTHCRKSAMEIPFPGCDKVTRKADHSNVSASPI